MKKLSLLVFIGIAFSSSLLKAQNPCMKEVKYSSIEDALAEPEKVKYLDLAMTRPKLKSVPKEVAKFPNLTCLDVSFNQVSSIPDEIKQCQNLKLLVLSGNRYLGKLPAVLKELPNLETIDVTEIPEWNDAKKKEAKAMLPNVNVITD